ncbi:hypothetical protein L9F63_016064, partial [Diploptera punctata]
FLLFDLIFFMFETNMKYCALLIAALVACTLAEEVPLDLSRVIGGTAASSGEFPYIVSLRSSANSHFCGGSIISNYYIITAAHCVTGRTAANTIVVAGTNTLNSGGTRYAVSRIVVHSGYSSSTIRNDIALLRLSSPITYTTLQQRITLPSQGETPATSAVAAGWGYASYPATSLPNNLQKVSLSIISNSQCSLYMGNIFTTSVCASGGNGRGVCNGDSGGPLVAGGKLVGLVSWGRPCAVGFPDVYTRVAEYISWINQNAV